MLGNFEVTFDKAGRMTVPQSHRRRLGEDLVVCPALPPGRYLMLFDALEFWEFLKRTFPTEPVTEEGLSLKRRVTGSAFEVSLDKAGRILVPQKLRDYAGIDGAAVAVGQANRLEIFSAERYDAWDAWSQTPEAAEEFNALRRQLSTGQAAA